MCGNVSAQPGWEEAPSGKEHILLRERTKRQKQQGEKGAMPREHSRLGSMEEKQSKIRKDRADDRITQDACWNVDDDDETQHDGLSLDDVGGVGMKEDEENEVDRLELERWNRRVPSFGSNVYDLEYRRNREASEEHRVEKPVSVRSKRRRREKLRIDDASCVAGDEIDAVNTNDAVEMNEDEVLLRRRGSGVPQNTGLMAENSGSLDVQRRSGGSGEGSNDPEIVSEYVSDHVIACTSDSPLKQKNERCVRKRNATEVARVDGSCDVESSDRQADISELKPSKRKRSKRYGKEGSIHVGKRTLKSRFGSCNDSERDVDAPSSEHREWRKQWHDGVERKPPTHHASNRHDDVIKEAEGSLPEVAAPAPESRWPPTIMPFSSDAAGRIRQSGRTSESRCAMAPLQREIPSSRRSSFPAHRYVSGGSSMHSNNTRQAFNPRSDTVDPVKAIDAKLKSIESFYSQAEDHFMRQMNTIMQIVSNPSFEEKHRTSPDRNAMNRAFNTALGIINHFKSAAPSSEADRKQAVTSAFVGPLPGAYYPPHMPRTQFETMMFPMYQYMQGVVSPWEGQYASLASLSAFQKNASGFVGVSVPGLAQPHVFGRPETTQALRVPTPHSISMPLAQMVPVEGSRPVAQSLQPGQS